MSRPNITIIGSIIVPSIAALVAIIHPGEARADHLDACGGIWLDVEAAASCQVLTKESCEQECTPPTVERVCATRLFEECAPSCTLTAEVDCQASCVESCDQNCITSASVDCSALCVADCGGAVTDSCGEAENQCGESASSCCYAECDAHCEASVDTECMPVCSTACSGSCVARANVDCQVECQTERFQTCSDTLVQECHEECETTGAAIFCDGHFLATGGNLAACADELSAKFDIDLDIDLDIDISGGHDGDCEDDEVDDIDDVDDVVGCSVAGPGAGTIGVLALLVIGGRMRRRNARAS